MGNISSLRRTTVKHIKGMVEMEGYVGSVLAQPEELVDIPSTERLQQAMDDSEEGKWALRDVLASDDIDEIIADIIKGTAIGVSDGSFKDQFGTASWVIENAKGTQRITGNVLIPGHHTDHSAYRSEIGGLYGLVLMTELIKQVWGIKEGLHWDVMD